MADISGIVNVQVSRVAAGTARREFGQTGYVGVVGSVPDPTTALVTLAALQNFARDASVRTYTTLAELEEDYGTSGDVYSAAAAYFAQIPYPRGLVIGNWFVNGAQSVLVGRSGVVVGDIQALSSSSDVSLNGAVSGAAAHDFSGDALAAAATALATLINGITGITNVTVVWNTAMERFVVSVPVAQAALLTGAFSGAVATAFGIDQAALTADTGPGFFVQGFAAETNPAFTLARMEATRSDFYFVVASNAIENVKDQIDEVAEWVQGRIKMLFVSGNSYGAGSVLLGYQIAGYSRVAGIYYEGTHDDKPMALAGVMSTTNFDAAGGLKDPNRKSLAGRRADVLTSTQLAALSGSRINYYIRRGDAPVFESGTTFESGTRYIYEQFWLDWFQNALQTEVWNLMRGSDFLTLDATGVSSLVNVVTQVCEDGILNGGIGPGRLQEALAGEARRILGVPSFDGYLQLGYLVLPADLDTLSASDLRQGRAPAITVLAKGTRTIRYVDINVKVGD